MSDAEELSTGTDSTGSDSKSKPKGGCSLLVSFLVLGSGYLIWKFHETFLIVISGIGFLSAFYLLSKRKIVSASVILVPALVLAGIHVVQTRQHNSPEYWLGGEVPQQINNCMNAVDYEGQVNQSIYSYTSEVDATLREAGMDALTPNQIIDYGLQEEYDAIIEKASKISVANSLERSQSVLGCMSKTFPETTCRSYFDVQEWSLVCSVNNRPEEYFTDSDVFAIVGDHQRGFKTSALKPQTLFEITGKNNLEELSRE